LRISIETNGTITPREALERSIEIMIIQLKSIVGFKEEMEMPKVSAEKVAEIVEDSIEDNQEKEDFLKTRIESLDLSVRTKNALENANIRTVGGLARKKEEDILDLEGMGSKGLSEIKKVLGEHGIELK
jgi:DNA-directed RNA polymerase subunit alpha